MASQRITFTEWTPDQPSIVENLSIAKNVVPAAVGFIPLPLAVDYSSAASENINNLFAGRFSTTTGVFAGGATKLFKYNGSTLALTDVSKNVARNITNVALTLNVATVTTEFAHGYSFGDTVVVDSSNNFFDGSFTIISAPTTTTFTYAKSNSKTITNVALVSNVATVTTSTDHGYVTGNVAVVDSSNNNFDGSYAITGTPTTTTFTYARTPTATITNVQLTSNVATITTAAAHNYVTGYTVVVDASNNSFDGTYTITGTPTTTTFTYARILGNIASQAATGTAIVNDIASAAATGSVSANITTASSTGTVTNAGYGSTSKWNFIQFGDTVIAANNVNKLQSFTLGTGSYFGDLSQYAPIAKYVTVVRDFVVSAHLDNGANANKVQWSNINDETNWTAGAASQSDFQIIPDGGNITGITGGETGLILMERAIVRMSYIGSPLFFQFDTISRSLGCVEGNSIAKYGNTTFFLGEDGFYACDGQTVTPIGNEKVDRWFYSNANPSTLDTISTAIDPFRKIVVWNFLNTFGSRLLIIYNWQVQKWSYGTTDTDYVASSATAGTTLEGMDLYGNMDTITTSFDSSLFTGGKFLFAGAKGAKIVTFTGQAAEAQIDTGQIGSEMPSVITLARPIVDNGSADVAIASEVKLDQVVDFGTYIPADSENRVPLRSAGKYHKLSIKPTGARWSNIIGVDIDIIGQGTR